uniref:EamA domain-containing protein n=1 Tax=Globisporangium ultimum (strain ATCC 200006 / CBS 805.95 / DAOM BR144) TaxID=431595 RepID=K3X111_GLOUD
MVLADANVIIVTSPVLLGFLFGYDHETAATDGSWIAIGSAFLEAISQAFVFISVRKLRGINVLVIVMSFLYIGIARRGFKLEKAGIASCVRVCVFIWDSVLLREHINHWSLVGMCAIVIALRKSNAQ